jgi:hypothetical protein
MRPKLIPLIVLTVLLAICHSAPAQNAVTKHYRGSVSGNHIQMSLTFNGNNVNGTYSYDRIGQDIKLTGQLDREGKLELTEFGEKNKPTGKFKCKRSFNDPIDRECYWSKPDGSGESLLTLDEQNLAFSGGLQIVPKLITNRAKGIVASYPQLASGGTLSAAAQKFNRRILAMTQKQISEFEPVDGKGAFDANYLVLLGTNDLVSVEMLAYEDAGGAHPNDSWWSLTYDLAADKELKFADLFKTGTDYNTAIAKYLTDDINRRAIELEKDEARRENRQPRQQEPLISMDQLTEISGFGLTPKGLVVYFDFPHVMAYFDKNFVPYTVVKQYLNPNGPLAKFQ